MKTNAPGNYAPETCAQCGGTGRKNRDYCPICGGVGSFMIAQPARKCPQCNGTGKNEDVSLGTPYCITCGGVGWMHKWSGA